jgi:hypothetical protein
MSIKIKPPKSEFKYVSVSHSSNAWYYVASIKIDGKLVRKYFDNERDAGKCVDLNLIQRGLEPINILKKINKQ